MNKKGISLVALVITIIVLIILTAAVVMTGFNTPENAEQAVRAYNQSMVQDAVTLYVMRTMVNEVSTFAPNATTMEAKTVAEILENIYAFEAEGEGDNVIEANTWRTDAEKTLGISLSNTELNDLYTLTLTGIVEPRSN